MALLLLLSFALPIREWRTGEVAVAPLATVRGGPDVTFPSRLWIDTDAACGLGRTTDPDDCFAILLLARAPGLEVAGISTVQGNAPLAQTDSVTRELAGALAGDGVPPLPIHRGHRALQAALQTGPLTVVALGPLTNVAAALDGRPDLQANVARLIAVMGRRPGHLFHPAEGEGEGGILFGHGPVFRDFNYEQDRTAAAVVFGMQLPTTLMPYDAARHVMLTESDLARLEHGGGASAWTAGRARGWLHYWEDDIGLPGFYPFDLLAAAYTLSPERFTCARAQAWIARDLRLWGRLWGPWGVLVHPAGVSPRNAKAHAPVVYCERPDDQLHGWLMGGLAGDNGV